MFKNLVVLFLLTSLGMLAQDKTDTDSNILTHVSRKGVYQIKYNKEHWQKKTTPTEWDVEFQDPHNLLNAYFMEFDYFIQEKDIKSIIKSQYEAYGKIKNLKIYKKKINDMNVNYFECELKYNDYLYKYEGFIYNGKGGSIEVQFSVQAEGSDQFRGLINEFYDGLTIINK